MVSRPHMLRTSAVVGIFSFLGSLTGILVEISIAARLGLSRSSDTFYAAFTIPYIITNFLKAAGQFSLVPFFSALDTRHAPEDLWRGFSYTFNVLFLGMGSLAALGALTAPWLIRGLAPGFTHSETVAASELCRLLFLMLVPAGVAEAIRSFLLSQHRFAVPASGSFFRNLTVIAAILFTFRRFGLYSLVWGYIAGYLVQLAILGAQLAASFPVRYSLTLAGSGEAFLNLRHAATAQLGAGVGSELRIVAERMIASFLPPGTLTALAYGLKLMTTLAEILSGSVGTAVLPALSRAFAHGNSEEAHRAFRHAVEIALALAFPAAVFCLMLPHHIIRLVFERGHFTPQMAALMARIFFCYSFSLLLYVGMRMLYFYLFAKNEPAAYLRLATLQQGWTIALDLLFAGVCHWTVAGIPLAMLTSLLGAAAFATWQNFGGFIEALGNKFSVYFLKVLAGAALAALVVWGLGAALPAPQSGFANFIFLCETCGAGIVAFFATLLLLRAFKLSQIASLWGQAEG